MGDDLMDEELAALDRIVARLEEYAGTDAASVGLVEEELLLMRFFRDRC